MVEHISNIIPRIFKNAMDRKEVAKINFICRLFGAKWVKIDGNKIDLIKAVRNVR